MHYVEQTDGGPPLRLRARVLEKEQWTASPERHVETSLYRIQGWTANFFFFSAQYLMVLGECCEGYMTSIIFPNSEVGSGMLGRGQGHTESDTGNDRESCFPVQPSLSQDILQSPCLFPRFQTTEME